MQQQAQHRLTARIATTKPMICAQEQRWAARQSSGESCWRPSATLPHLAVRRACRTFHQLPCIPRQASLPHPPAPPCCSRRTSWRRRGSAALNSARTSSSMSCLRQECRRSRALHTGCALSLWACGLLQSMAGQGLHEWPCPLPILFAPTHMQRRRPR